MDGKTAYKIVQNVDGEQVINYVQSDYVAGKLTADSAFDVTAIGYEDTRSEWEKIVTATSILGDADVSIDHEAAVDALNFGAVADHYQDGTADELERVGTNWDEASDAERRAFAILFEKLQKMARDAERLLESRVW